jgi:CRP-like cAMP-binding protein
MAVTCIEDLKLPVVTFSAGDIILEEGITSSRIYILQTGNVSITAKGEEICKIDTKGAVFGETSVLNKRETSAEVKAVEESKFLLVDDAEEYLKGQPELIYNIAQILASRLVHMNELFLEMKGAIPKKVSDKIKAKLYSFMIITNRFFDRDVMHPLQSGETEEKNES